MTVQFLYQYNILVRDHDSSVSIPVQYFSQRHMTVQFLYQYNILVRDHDSSVSIHSTIFYSETMTVQFLYQYNILVRGHDSSVSISVQYFTQRPWHFSFFFFNDTATTEIYTLTVSLSLNFALPIWQFSFYTNTIF
jgi:hypothetical protein